MMINKLFDLLDDWRNLPAYQLERRADIIFALHLEMIIDRYANTEIEFIIPEFPVRKGQIISDQPELNNSYKIDYLAYSKRDDRAFLIELKTDQRSRRDDQDWYLKRSAQIGLRGIIDGVIDIYKATNQTVKYQYLIDKIESFGWITRKNSSLINAAPDISPEIIYIQPHKTDNQENQISFDRIIDLLNPEKGMLTQRFIASLEKWKLDTNERH